MHAICDRENDMGGLHLVRMQGLIDNGADCTQQCTDMANRGRTAMHFATTSHHDDGLAMMGLLFMHGVSVDGASGPRRNNLLHDICAWIPLVEDNGARMRWVLERSRDMLHMLAHTEIQGRTPLVFAREIRDLRTTPQPLLVELIEIMERAPEVQRLQKAVAIGMILHPRLGAQSQAHGLDKELVEILLHSFLDE